MNHFSVTADEKVSCAIHWLAMALIHLQEIIHLFLIDFE